MKTFRLLSYLFIATLCMTSFASCSDDDDNLPVDQFKTSIVGTWEVKHVKGWGIEEGDKETWDEKVEAGWLYTLESDGTGYETEDDYDLEFDWTITNTKLRLTYSFGTLE